MPELALTQQKSLGAQPKKQKTNVSVPYVSSNNNHSTVESSESCETSTGASPSDNKEKEETVEQLKDKCRDRIDQYKRSIKKNMPLCD